MLNGSTVVSAAGSGDEGFGTRSAANETQCSCRATDFQM